MIGALALLFLVSPSSPLPSLHSGGPPIAQYALPDFPLEARMARLAGYGAVELSIQSSGYPLVVAFRGSHPIFAASAADTAAQFRFSASRESERCATILIQYDLLAAESDLSNVQLVVLSPHEFIVTAARFPPARASVTVSGEPAVARGTWGCPVGHPCLVQTDFRGTRFCERALQVIPFQ